MTMSMSRNSSRMWCAESATQGKIGIQGTRPTGWFQGFCGFFVMLACAGSLSAAELTFDAWVDSYSTEWVRGDPILATVTQYFDGEEQDDLDRKLTPITKEFRAARVALARHGLDELAKFDRASLLEPQRV